MLDNIKSTFSITDLHHLSGVSAHTIRIWERRFDLLQPDRTETNIRQYNNKHLKKLLNISLLVKSGYKISELAALSEQQLIALVNSSQARSADDQHHIDQLKLSMMDFNSTLFNDTYARLLSEMSFYDLFVRVFVPFLEQIGHLWQTNSITIAQEHFISNLIRQKLFFNIDRMPRSISTEKKRYVLFLPNGELHELGLLFLHYVLLMSGRDSIYLGHDVDVDTLSDIALKDTSIVFVSFFTMAPLNEELEDYFTGFRKKLLDGNNEFWVTGGKLKEYKKNKNWTNLSVFPDVRVLLNKLRQ